MPVSSRIPGFYRLPLAERRAVIAAAADVPLHRLSQVMDDGGIDPNAADKIVENVLGVYGLPFGIALNFRINDEDRLLPMVVEEPSVIAAASNAARMVREAGGFQAMIERELMTAQVQLFDVPDAERAHRALIEATEELLALGRDAVPNLLKRGGGPRELSVRLLGQGVVVVHVQVDCKDAMGANLVNSVAEAIGPRAAALAVGQLGLRILTNLCDQRRVKVSCRVNAHALVMAARNGSGGTLESWAPVPGHQGEDVLDGIVQASRFAELDPYRAATHNKGIMNGIDSVVIATGNDYRAVEAGAHAYAAQGGRYKPLAVWTKRDGQLYGELEMPLSLGIVGGTLRVHPTARIALELAAVKSAADLAALAGAAGLASNLAALRALATEGIQRGHMSLHARSVASAAGALNDEVERVALALCQSGQITVDNARAVLGHLRRVD